MVAVACGERAASGATPWAQGKSRPGAAKGMNPVDPADGRAPHRTSLQKMSFFRRQYSLFVFSGCICREWGIFLPGPAGEQAVLMVMFRGVMRVNSTPLCAPGA